MVLFLCVVFFGGILYVSRCESRCNDKFYNKINMFGKFLNWLSKKFEGDGRTIITTAPSNLTFEDLEETEKNSYSEEDLRKLKKDDVFEIAKNEFELDVKKNTSKKTMIEMLLEAQRS